MKRVIAFGLVCVVLVAQGCSVQKTHRAHPRGFVVEPSTPYHLTQSPRLNDLESEKLKIARMEAITTAVVIAGRVTVEILRVIR
jgi:hypothetical protein